MASFKKPGNDVVFLRRLSTRAVVGLDRWHNPDIQPVEIDIEISKKRRIVKNRGDDNVDRSVRYDILEAAVCKAITSHGNFESVHQFANLILRTTNDQENIVPQDTIVVTVRLPKALLLTDGIGYSLVQRFNTHSGTSLQALPSSRHVLVETCAFVKNLRVSCVIGMLSQERPEKQALIVNLWLHEMELETLEMVTEKLQHHVRALNNIIEGSNFATLEALANTIAKHLISRDTGLGAVTVAMSKPSALTFVEDAGIEITRYREDFDS